MISPKSLLIPVLLIPWLAAAQQKVIKPVPAGQTSAASGKEMYMRYCAVCHGKDGKGGGPAAPALKVPPPDLTTLAKSNDGKFPAAHVSSTISGDVDIPAHGSKDMPVWGHVFRSMSAGSSSEVFQRLTNLTEYVRSLQAK
jgi:mono/diheme cytochrome c family protein